MAGPASANRAAATPRRLVASVAALWCVGLLIGCATPGPPPTIPSEAAPTSSASAVGDSLPASGQRTTGAALAEGAVQGAGVGAIASVVMLAIGVAVFPPLGIPLALGMAPVLVGAGAIGGMARTAINEPAPEATEAVRSSPGRAEISRSPVEAASDIKSTRASGAEFSDVAWRIDGTSQVQGRLLIGHAQTLTFEPFPLGLETLRTLRYVEIKEVVEDPASARGPVLCVVLWSGTGECFSGIGSTSGRGDAERTEVAYRLLKTRVAAAHCVGCPSP